MEALTWNIADFKPQTPPRSMVPLMAHELETVEACKRVGADPILGEPWRRISPTWDPLGAAKALYAEIWAQCASWMDRDEGVDVEAFAKAPMGDLQGEILERYGEGLDRWDWIMEQGGKG